MASDPPFHVWLKTALGAQGRSQSALARSLGLDASAINRLVHGKRDLRVREIEGIAAYLRATNGTKEEADYLSRAVGGRELNSQEKTRQLVDRMVEGQFRRRHEFQSNIAQAGGGLQRALTEAGRRASRMSEKRAQEFANLTSQLMLDFNYEDRNQVLVEALYRLGEISEEGRDDLILIFGLFHHVRTITFEEESDLDRHSFNLIFGLLKRHVTDQMMSPLEEDKIRTFFVAICLAYELLLTLGDDDHAIHILNRARDRLDQNAF